MQRDSVAMGTPVQFLVRKCPHCTADLQVYDGVFYLPCRACGTNMYVIRKRGNVMLKPVGADKPAADITTAGLSGELDELSEASVRTHRGKIMGQLTGGFCLLLFGVMGASCLRTGDWEMGLAMLACAGGSIWFVIHVVRDSRTTADRLSSVTKNVRRQLAENERIGVQGVRASALGVDQLAFDLFLNEITHYPAWIERSREQVPATVTRAVQAGPDSVKLKLNESEYLFTLTREKLDETNDHGRLDILVDNIPVLTVSAAISHQDFKAQTTSHYVTAFVESPWVQEFFALSTAAAKIRRSGVRG